MKKIALFLTFALALSSMLTAQDVSVNGWLETKGDITTMSGEALTDDAKKSTVNFGATTLDLEVNVSGENFGAHAMLETWAGRNADYSAGYEAAPHFINTYIWSNFGELVTLYAGISTQAINYSPAPAVEGGMFFDDGFGKGLGAYNYQNNGNGYTNGITGLIAEVNVADFSAALAFRNDVGADAAKSADDPGLPGTKFEDAVKNDIILNAKYSHEMVDVYAGVALLEGVDKDAQKVAQNGIWLAASLKLVPGLMSDIKLELGANDSDWDGVKDTKYTNIALNLGYELEMMKIATETTIELLADQTGNAAKTLWLFQGAITPYLTDIVDLAVVFKVNGDDGKDAADKANPISYSFGLDVVKGIGNVSNRLSLGYGSSTAEKPVGAMVVQYAVNIWF